MAEEKKGFLLYADQIGAIKKLVLKDRQDNTNNGGELFLHILEYVNDNDPEPINFIVDVAFEPIKMRLKRDLIKYEDVKEDKSNSGKLGNLKRWNRDLYDKVISKKLSLEDAVIIALSRKTSHSDNFIANVAVNDNGNVNDNVSDITSTNVDVIPNTFDNSKNLLHCLVLKKEALQWQETVAMQLKIAPAEIPKKLDEFTTFLSTTFKEHHNKKEFISHFINWLPKNLINEKSNTNVTGTKKQFRFNTEAATEAITGNSSGRSSED